MFRYHSNLINNYLYFWKKKLYIYFSCSLFCIHTVAYTCQELRWHGKRFLLRRYMHVKLRPHLNAMELEDIYFSIVEKCLNELIVTTFTHKIHIYLFFLWLNYRNLKVKCALTWKKLMLDDLWSFFFFFFNL